MRVLCITPVNHIDGVMDILTECGDVDYHPRISRQECKSLIDMTKPDAIFVNPNKMGFRLDKHMLSKSSVKIIATASTGINHIDCDFCDSNNISVLSLTKEYDTINKISSTAEHAFALMMAIIRNIPSSFRSAQNLKWNYEPFVGRQLDHLTVGIVGLGRLGSMFKKYCNAFGMHVLHYDPYVSGSVESLEDLVFQSDVLSLHVHLTHETSEMIDRNVLRYADGIYLINTSRGGIVNEENVIEAMELGSVVGYATDVISDELGEVSCSPIINRSNDLNIIVTPHIGGMTCEGQQIAYSCVAGMLRELSSV